MSKIIRYIDGVLTPYPADEEAALYAKWKAEDIEIAKNEIRSIRNELLIYEVDPIVTNPLRWDALSTDKQNEWKTYRQALLDVPAQSGFPNSVTWPTKPT
tara:strand:+ start:488 stop:787 length:300 start_codon:yes stop_codon:yes gene_type:complete